MGDLISQNNRKYIKFTMTVNQKRTGSVNRPGHPSSFRSAHCTLICTLSCSSGSTQITTFVENDIIKIPFILQIQGLIKKIYVFMQFSYD